ncbi:hypothetical protein GCWU000246_00586 [Jonquetella anthropi E3_33 E1]|nr:hypothetical protein GCWU000246_00586 [Jonquetella anthropi E3_33 E1]
MTARLHRLASFDGKGQVPSPKPQAPSPKPEAPSPKPQARSPKPEAPSPKPEAPSPKPQARSPKPEAPSPKPEAPSPKPQARSPKPEAPSPKPQARSPKPEAPSPKPQARPRPGLSAVVPHSSSVRKGRSFPTSRAEATSFLNAAPLSRRGIFRVRWSVCSALRGCLASIRVRRAVWQKSWSVGYQTSDRSGTWLSLVFLV